MATNGKLNKVLVVEDDPFINELLQTILTEEGYQAVPAYDGATALQMVREIHPRLITLDLALPEADGYQVLKSLRGDDSTRDIPVIILSAYTDELHCSTRNLASRIVEKPFDLSELLRAVAEVADSP